MARDSASISDCASDGFQTNFLTLVLNLFLSLKESNHFEETLKNFPYTSEFLDKETNVFLPLK